MKDVPVTYWCDLASVSEAMRQYMMHAYAEAGIKYLVLTDSLLKEILKDGRLVGKLLAEMSAEGLSFMDSHALFGGIFNLCSVDESLRRHMILLNKLQLAIVAEMGVNTITMHPGNDAENMAVPLETQKDNVLRMLEVILPEAEACGVTICIENSWSRLSHPNNLLYFKSHFPTDRLGFCYDCGHANILSSQAKQYEESAAKDRWTIPYGIEPDWDDQILEKMLPHIVNCHLHDNHAQRDEHDLPGTGNVDWNHVMRGLDQAPRLQCIQSEVSVTRRKVSPTTLFRTFDNLMKL